MPDTRSNARQSHAAIELIPYSKWAPSFDCRAHWPVGLPRGGYGIMMRSPWVRPTGDSYHVAASHAVQCTQATLVFIARRDPAS